MGGSRLGLFWQECLSAALVDSITAMNISTFEFLLIVILFSAFRNVSRWCFLDCAYGTLFPVNRDGLTQFILQLWSPTWKSYSNAAHWFEFICYERDCSASHHEG